MRKIAYLIILLTVSSCAVSKAEKYLKEGETVQKSFKETIPFEIKNGFIILKAKINHKSYNFILDTGASSSCVGFEAIETFNLKVKDSKILAAGAGATNMETKVSKKNKVKIGKWCTIGAGTIVIKDIPDYSTVVGNPGRIIKTSKPQ